MQRGGFAVGVCDDDLLRTGAEAGRRCHEKSVGILEGDSGWFSIDGDRSATSEAATTDGESSAAGCGNCGGCNGADSQGNSGELNDSQGSVLGPAIRVRDSQDPLAIFILVRELT